MSQRAVQTGRSSRTWAGWGQSVRAAFTLLALLAFTCQVLVTQAHIHVGDGQHAAPSDSSGGNSKQPADDPAYCPFCQQILMAGHFAPPEVILLPLPPPVPAGVLLLSVSAAWGRAIAHTWLGRAPPRL